MATTPNTTLPINAREALIEALDDALHGGSAPVALALSDLDGFADINRDRGHDIGDQVLALWEQTFQSNVPSDATVLRLGGDEYVAILPTLSVENALIVLDEIRSHFARHVDETLGVACAASIGVAANPPHGTTADALFQAAGQALMRAKQCDLRRREDGAQEQLLQPSESRAPRQDLGGHQSDGGESVATGSRRTHREVSRPDLTRPWGFIELGRAGGHQCFDARFNVRRPDSTTLGPIGLCALPAFRSDNVVSPQWTESLAARVRRMPPTTVPRGAFAQRNASFAT
jgi:diguanylate cyclase (GGDEF)-like protein